MLAAELLNGAGRHVRMRLVVTLELQGRGQRGFLQQAALGAELVGGHRLALGRERRVQYLDIRHRLSFRSIGRRRQTRGARQQGDGRAREGSGGGFEQEQPTRR